MRQCQPVTSDAIERHLEALGAGNHSDNLGVLRQFRYYCRLVLTEAEFFGLVFLQNAEVRSISPTNSDRTLRAVAQRALALRHSRLSLNWDIAAIRSTFRELRELYPLMTTVRLPELLLRDARGSEAAFGDWYLQDGSHRALGYALELLDGRQTYVPQAAFIATGRPAEVF